MTPKESRSSAGTLTDQSLKPLSELRDASGRRVRNAENFAATREGRIFVSGSDDVFEIVDRKKEQRQLEPIPVTAPGVPQTCWRNGLVASDTSLFVACSYYRSARRSLLPFDCERLNTMEQSLFNISLAYALHLPCEVVSWILRADLTAHSPAFADVVAEFPPPFLANGLDVDVSGEHLFVANSLGGRSSGIYRVSIERGAQANPEEPWYAPACEPNGIKVRNHTVYYTGNNTVPVLRAVLGRVDINASGEPTGGQSLYQRLFSTFDDFDVAADGFVVASFADFANPWTWIQPRTFSAGGLRFVSSEGQDLGSVPGVRRPSAVLIVGDSNVFDKGEVLIADKDTHGVLQLTPDDAWRRWLCGVTAPAPRHHPKAA